MSSIAQMRSSADSGASGESHQQPDAALQSSARGPLSSLRGGVISLVSNTTDCLVLDDETGDKENVNPDGEDYGVTIGLENLRLGDSTCSPFQEISNPTVDQPRSKRS